MSVSRAKADERIVMPLGAWPRVGPRNYMLDGVQISRREGATLMANGGSTGTVQMPIEVYNTVSQKKGSTLTMTITLSPISTP